MEYVYVLDSVAGFLRARLISPNKKTGTISGVPIATSDPVTYTVTAALMAMMEVDRHAQDTATVVIAVGFVLVMVTGVIALPTVALT
jgi:hypothetical protein